MKIRRANLEDIPNIVRLEHQVFEETLGESFLYDELSLNPFARMYILEDQNHFIGFIGLRVDDQAELMNFAIVPKYQHKGYGKALLTHVLKELQTEGIKMLSLEVRQSNKQAQAFYEKMGFTVSHIRKNYYKHEDALVYVLEVKS